MTFKITIEPYFTSMLEEFIISSYLLFSSWIYGYFVIRRAFWVVRLVPSKQRIKLALMFGLPLVVPFVLLVWLIPPLYLFAALSVVMYAYSYYVQTHPKYLMRELLNYIGVRELVEQQPSDHDIRVMVLKQRLLRSVELNKELIDKISEEIRMLRETLKSMEAEQTDKVPIKVQNPTNNVSSLNEETVAQESRGSSESQELLSDKDLQLIQEKIRRLRKKYELE